MGEFVQFAMEQYKKQYPAAKLWTGMSAANAASMGLAAKLGFKRRDDLFDVEKNWVAMTQE
jgi:RimJ/RimL family protein N-acetyltransferase